MASANANSTTTEAEMEKNQIYDDRTKTACAADVPPDSPGKAEESGGVERREEEGGDAEEGDAEGGGAEGGGAEGKGGYTLWFTRMQEERLFELRHLKHGVRTVTREDGPKGKIAGFFHRMTGQESNDQNQAEEEEEEHRPESVLFEVRQLSSVRPVTSLLQTQAFRRRLETAVRDGIARLAPTHAANTSTPVAATASAAARSGTATATTFGNTRPAATADADDDEARSVSAATTAAASSVAGIGPDRNSSLGQITTTTTSSAAGVSTVLTARRRLERPPGPRRNPPRRHRPTSPSRSNLTPPNASVGNFRDGSTRLSGNSTTSAAGNVAEWLRRDVAAGAVAVVPDAAETEGEPLAAAAESMSYEQMADLRRQELVFEISSLVHQGLVSNTLESRFRSTLERQMASRLSQVGTETGRRVARYMTRLPPPSTAVSRNDFSALGLATGRQDDVGLEDAESIFEGSSSYIHIQHNNGAVMRQLNSLKQQMASLQQMMRLQMEMQADVQRAIRQEVSAAINANLGADDVTASTYRRTNTDGLCVICLEEGADAVFIHCGHMSCCVACAQRLHQSNGKCPICRAPIRDVVKVYKATADRNQD